MRLYHQKDIYIKHLSPLTIYSILLLVSFFSPNIEAQPSFPSTPDPAPIDGGLGLLAAAGGAYAYKKLTYLKANFDKAEDADEKNM